MGKLTDRIQNSSKPRQLPPGIETSIKLGGKVGRIQDALVNSLWHPEEAKPNRAFMYSAIADAITLLKILCEEMDFDYCETEGHGIDRFNDHFDQVDRGLRPY